MDGESGSASTDITKLALENCHPVYSETMRNGKELRVFASDGFHLNYPALLADCNRMMEVLAEFSPRPLQKNLALFYFATDKAPDGWRWSMPVTDTVNFILVFSNGQGNSDKPSFGADKGHDWNTTSGECAIAGFLCHELTHLVAPVFFMNARGMMHRHAGSGWFGEGLAEYANYLAWDGSDLCTWQRADASFALLAFEDRSRRKHLWRWQSGIKNDWNAYAANNNGEEHPTWPDITSASRATFMAPDYTTALGAFLFMERIKGRKELLESIQRIVAGQHFQGQSFYDSLHRELGFDIREITSKEIRQMAACANRDGSCSGSPIFPEGGKTRE